LLFADIRKLIDPWAPEVEIAYARTFPDQYLASLPDISKPATDWRTTSSVASALGEMASLPDTVKNKTELKTRAESQLRLILAQNAGTSSPPVAAYAVPDILRALAGHKPIDLSDILRRNLNHSDVIIKATAAELLGDLPPSEETTTALSEALPRSEHDELNDAVLSILDSLAKQKNERANNAIATVLGWKDHLVRRRAVALLKQNGVGELSIHIGIVQTPNTRADYVRAISRIGRQVRAVVTTTKGSFTIELFPNEATLTVDNFVRLAQRGYFRGVTIHRVVPNFVIQDGDPRGDGNGGPGYQIRCEINEVPYDRAAVGMALSGKDTGGSQWFITHSPQPHLDGGYTVFGRVVDGMEVVDSIVRGDKIQSVTIR